MLRHITSKAMFSIIIKNIIALSITLLALEGAHAGVVTVCPSGCDYTNISAGVNAAHAGDTVEVHSGTYVENIDVRKPIILHGVDTGSGRPLVDANYNDSGITLAADGIVVEGFEINHSLGSWFDLWAGINVASNNSIIKNNIVIDNENGILIDGFSNNTLAGNLAINNKYGIKLIGSSDNNIRFNSVYNNTLGRFPIDRGILLISSDNNTISENLIADNFYGVILNNSTGNTLRNNSMHKNRYNFGAERYNDVDASNSVDQRPIYFISGASDLVVNSSSDAGTVYCFNCRNITIEGLSLTNNLFGIYISNITKSIIENNNLNNNAYGLKMDATEDNIIINNTICENLISGISSNTSERNHIKFNLLSGNGDTGIFLACSAEEKIIDNSVIYNYNGLVLSRSNGNEVAANNISLNKNFGIGIIRSGYSNISSNELINNSIGASIQSSWMNNAMQNLIQNNKRGIQLHNSYNNHIYNNNMSGNKFALSRNLYENNNLENISPEEVELITPGPTSLPPGIILPKFIEINFSSIPPGAEVLIDGRPQGMTNLTIDVLEGRHDLEIDWRDQLCKETFDTANKTKFIVDSRKCVGDTLREN